MKRTALFAAACWIVCATGATGADSRLGKNEQMAVGFCVSSYVAPRAISERCASSSDPSTCKETETTKWSAAPDGLAAYPDRAACTCAVSAVRTRLHRKGVQFLLTSPQDPFRADPNNDAGELDRGNRLKTAVLQIARTCKVPAF